jgi:hypothetical protein
MSKFGWMSLAQALSGAVATAGAARAGDDSSSTSSSGDSSSGKKTPVCCTAGRLMRHTGNTSVSMRGSAPVSLSASNGHGFSPQVEIRPEVAYYLALDAPAFNGNFNVSPVILPNRRDALIVAADLIWRF